MEPTLDVPEAGQPQPPSVQELRSALDAALGDSDGDAAVEELVGPCSYFTERPIEIADANLTGDGRSISIGDILGLLSSLGKTGLLWVTTARERFLLQMVGGAVVFAQSDRPPPGSRLGEILVARGTLKHDDLGAAIQASRAEHAALGAWLQERQLVSSSDLRAALALQVQQIFNRMFMATDSIYQFEDGKRLPQSDDVRLNVVQLLLESARQSDEGLRGVNMPVPLGRAQD